MPATTHPVPCTVRETATGAGVFTTRDIAPGEQILAINGDLQGHPTRSSIQIDQDQHIECHESLPSDEMRTRYPWRFLNHCCEPNAIIAGRTLIARRAIRAGEHVTFDYTTTEASMAEPFECRCGAPTCIGRVRGFLMLPAAAQSARAAFVAPHLKSFLPKPGA